MDVPGSTLAVDNSGNVAAADFKGNVAIYTAPLTNVSTPSAQFSFSFNQLSSNKHPVFGPSGKLFIPITTSTGNGLVAVFTPPFSSASVPSQVVSLPTNLGEATAVGVDNADNLYVGSGLGPIFISVLSPPYTTISNSFQLVSGVDFGDRLEFDNNFLVAKIGFPGMTEVDVLPLPLGPAGFFLPPTPPPGPLIGPGGLAVDANNNLYVGDFYNSRVLVYAPPLSSSSTPNVILSLPGEQALSVGK
jgi:hypothetical protein